MAEAKGPTRDRRAYTIVELVIVCGIVAVLTGVIIQALVVGIRVVSRESTQTDMHALAQRAVERMTDDAREAWAVLETFTVPPGWSDSGHAYVTTRGDATGLDLADTAEDDRFTVIYLLPSLSGGTVLLSPDNTRIAAFDAVVWTLTRSDATAGKRFMYQRLHDLHRSVYPAAALSSSAYTYGAPNSVNLEGVTRTLDRQYGRTLMAYNVVQASYDEMESPAVGKLARPTVLLRNADGVEIAHSPKDVVPGSTDVTAVLAPLSVTGGLSPEQQAALPFVRDGAGVIASARVPVTDASLLDFRIAVWESAPGVYRTPPLDRGKIAMYTSTNVRLRNKHHW